MLESSGRSWYSAKSRNWVNDVVDDVSREDDDDVLTDLGQQIVESVALLRVQPGRRLIHDNQ